MIEEMVESLTSLKRIYMTLMAGGASVPVGGRTKGLEWSRDGRADAMIANCDREMDSRLKNSIGSIWCLVLLGEGEKGKGRGKSWCYQGIQCGGVFALPWPALVAKPYIPLGLYQHACAAAAGAGTCLPAKPGCMYSTPLPATTPYEQPGIATLQLA
jgi:hypothetical protein